MPLHPLSPPRTMTEDRPEVKPGLQWLRARRRHLLSGALLAGLVAINLVTWRHARAMAHFARAGARTASPEKLGALAKMRALLTGVTLPRPENRRTPMDAGLAFETVRFPGTRGIQMEAWFVPGAKPSANGITLLFHGYGASKESLLAAAGEFHALGWDTLLVDFHGSGGSAGNTTSVGWHEAEDVAAAFAAAARLAPGKRRVLYGVSMGAAACLRAIHALEVKPDGLIMECPFDRMLTTVRHRFHAMHLPSFPLAELLVFWGGWEEASTPSATTRRTTLRQFSVPACCSTARRMPAFQWPKWSAFMRGWAEARRWSSCLGWGTNPMLPRSPRSGGRRSRDI